MFGMFTLMEGMTTGLAILVWFGMLAFLFITNELTRRFKWVGFATFFVFPIVMSFIWYTVMKDTVYTDWFHLVKLYSCTAGCIGFWLIRYVKGKNKQTGLEWRMSETAFARYFPPAILAINIAEAVLRDFQVGNDYWGVLTTIHEYNQVQTYLGGPWNYMNAIAGILNVITITGYAGICIRKKTKKDGSRDMIWPDMLWFWVIAYDIWNFAYTYNCLPGQAWYCGLALLIAPTLCAFTVGKGAWLQHRAHTLAIYCFINQSFTPFFDTSIYSVKSSNNPKALFIVSLLALIINVAVFAYMIYKVRKTSRNPYKGELYTDLAKYKEIKELEENYILEEKGSVA